MNLVEISEMLKGVPDTYLTKHVQAPDGTVPQYLALAELQRRQDMRARFAQQSPQSTVADDAVQGIPQMPPQMPAPMPASMPAQGFSQGGEVEDTTIDQIMRALGIRNLPSEKKAYESEVAAAQSRQKKILNEMGPDYRSLMRARAEHERRETDLARSKMLRTTDPIQEEFKRQAAALSPEQIEESYQQFLKMQDEKRAAENAAKNIDYDKIFAPIPEGYSRGGAVERYISNASTFESGNNPNAKNPFSTASGRFQFIDSTRRRLDKRYGFDPKDRSAETEMARMKAYTQETIDTLEKNNIPVTGGTLYGGHFLGQGGIKKFFEAYSKDPSTNVSEHFSAEIIRKNPAIFNPRGGKPRNTLAEVMEKFDRVGGGRQKTPTTGEDMNLGAAIQVANKADRGDTGGYEDLNMPQAMALATLMEKSKLGKEPYYYPETSPPLRQPDFFYNPIDQQVRAQLLQRYQSPGIMGSMGGFADGGMVKGYSGQDGISYVRRADDEYYRVNPITGQLEIDPNAPPYMPNMQAVDRGEVLPQFEYTDAELAKQFGGGGVSPKKKEKEPAATSYKQTVEDYFKNKIEENKKSGEELRKRATDRLSVLINKRPPKEEYLKSKKTAEGWEEWRNKILAEENPMIGKGDIPEAAFEAGRYVKALSGTIPWALAKINQGANALEGRLFEDNVAGSWDKKPGAKPPSQFFYTPESAASTGGSGILGGAGINLPPYTPAAPPSAEEVAAAGQRLREEAGAPAAPSIPAATPPASKFDTFADQFLQELRDAKMSKEEMRQMALLQAGLGMMAGTSPNFGVNVGQGAMAGLQAYQQAKAQNQALASEAYKNMMAARGLGLDERRVDAAERAAAAEAKYREGMMEIQKSRIAALMQSAAVKSSGLAPAVAVQIIKGIQDAEINAGRLFTPQEFNEMFLKQAQGPLVVGSSSGGIGVDVTEE